MNKIKQTEEFKDKQKHCKNKHDHIRELLKKQINVGLGGLYVCVWIECVM